MNGDPNDGNPFLVPIGGLLDLRIGEPDEAPTNRAEASAPQTPRRYRDNSLNQQSSPTIPWSSPVVGTKEQKAAIRLRKRQKINDAKKAYQKSLKDKERSQRKEEQAAKKKHDLEERQRAQLLQEAATSFTLGHGVEHNVDRDADTVENERRLELMGNALDSMSQGGVTFGDFILYVSDPKYRRGKERNEGLFNKSSQVVSILDLWASWKNKKGAQTVRDWAVRYTCTLAADEGNAATTKVGVLQSNKHTFDESLLLGFNYRGLCRTLEDLCPTMVYVMRSFCETTRQKRNESEGSLGRKQRRIGSSLLGLLGERSQRNSMFKHIMGLYLYTTGAQRQLISVMSSLGISSSYTTIAGGPKKRARSPAPKKSDPAALEADSDSDTSSDSEWEYISEDESSDEDSDSTSFTSEDDGGLDDSPDLLPEDLGNATRNQTKGSAKSTKATTGVAEQDAHRGGSTGGILRSVSTACRESARQATCDGECGFCYDNINFSSNVGEQILGRKDAQENGTCATIFPLLDASPADMKTDDLTKSYTEAPLLSTADIILSPEEVLFNNECTTHTILRIIVNHGGESFSRFKDEVFKTTPISDNVIPVHQTKIYPLPSMPIDESSITGNADVIEAITAELTGSTKAQSLAPLPRTSTVSSAVPLTSTSASPMSHETSLPAASSDLSPSLSTPPPTSPPFVPSPASANVVKLLFGDQLSLARIRSLYSYRVGHDHPRRSFLDWICCPGFFHYQMHLAYGTLETHWGDQSLGARDPGSLAFHNILLDRKAVVLSAMPPYRTSRDLVFVSLYARVLHCLERVTCCASLEEYAKKVTFAQLQLDAKKIMVEYANPRVVEKLRKERAVATRKMEEGKPVEAAGDMVFENAVLFLRDALLMREFNDTIKAGDSGRMIIVLKQLALSYRGSGRTKYAHELLHLIHQLVHIWPQELRNIIMHNWLVNPTGRANVFIPVDLLQEHLNFWIKVIYRAQGSNASWEWLETISPCIDLLRGLVNQINEMLGSRQGSKHHSPDLSNDIRETMKSLRTHHVYYVERGRTIEGEKAQVPNVQVEGLNLLQPALDDYNESFSMLRARRLNKPLVGATNEVFAAPMVSLATPGDSDAMDDLVGDNASEGGGDVRDQDEDWFEGDNIMYADSGVNLFSLDSWDDVELDF